MIRANAEPRAPDVADPADGMGHVDQKGGGHLRSSVAITRGFYVRLKGAARLWARLAPPFMVEWRFLGSGDWRGRCCESMR